MMAILYMLKRVPGMGLFLFHSRYMPPNVALRKAIDRMSLLNPFPEVIAPQHGYVVRSDLIVEYLNRLSDPNVGMDLLASKEPGREQFLLAINDFKERIASDYPFIFARLYERLKSAGNVTTPTIIDGDERIETAIPPSDAVRFLLSVLEDELGEEDFSKVRSLFALGLEKYNISHLLEIVGAEEFEESIDMNNILSAMT